MASLKKHKVWLLIAFLCTLAAVLGISIFKKQSDNSYKAGQVVGSTGTVNVNSTQSANPENYQTYLMMGLCVQIDNKNGYGPEATNAENNAVTFYKDWIPSAGTSDNAFYVIPTGNGTTLDSNNNQDDVRYAWYDSSRDELVYYNDDWSNAAVGLDMSKVNYSGGIFKPTLKTLYTQENGGMPALADWETIFSDSSYIEKSIQQWRYFAGTGTEGGVEDRIVAYMGTGDLDLNNISGWSTEEREEAFLSYLDLLLTCRYAVGNSPSASAKWTNIINGYLNEGPKVDVSNYNLFITPALLVKIDCLTDDPNLMVVSMMDAINWCYSIKKSYDISSKDGSNTVPGVGNPGGLDGTLWQINQVITANVNSLNKLSTEYPSETDLGFRLLVHSMKHRLNWDDLVLHEAYEGMNFISTMWMQDKLGGPQYYGKIMVMGVPLAASPVQSMALTSKFKVLWANDGGNYIELDDTQESIQDTAALIVSLECPKEDIPAWDSICDTYEKFYLSFNIKSESANGGTDTSKPRHTETTKDKDGVTCTLDNPSYTIDGADYTLGNKVEITREVLRKLIKGEMEFTRLYDKATRSQVIALSELQTFGYDLNVTIYYTNADGSNGGSYTTAWTGWTYDTSSKDKEQHQVTAFRSNLADSPKISWYSEPEAYAEIKEGTVDYEDTGSHEAFEAMAGVPSTEMLYFASGGSEFIVELELEYVQGEEGYRVYGSAFNGTECEFKHNDAFWPMATKNGTETYKENEIDTNQTSISVTSPGSTLQTGVHIISKMLVADESGYDTTVNYSNKTPVQWYNWAVAGTGTGTNGTTASVTQNESLNGHTHSWERNNPNGDAQMSSSTISAQWTGIIWNHRGTSTEQAPSSSHISGYIQGNPAPDCQGGEDGYAGDFAEQGTTWDVSGYNSAIDEALKWVQAYEKTNETYTAKMLADSDGYQRVWRIGKATINVTVGGSRSNQGGGSYFGGTYNSGSLSSAKKSGTLAEFGYNFSFSHGTDGVAGTHGDSTSGDPPVTVPHGDDQDGIETVGSTVTGVGDLPYTITVTFDNGTLDAHELCGTCCSHDLPLVADYWIQRMKYDYARLNVCRVYKIYRSYVDGMEEITFADYMDEDDLANGDDHMLYSGPIRNHTEDTGAFTSKANFPIVRQNIIEDSLMDDVTNEDRARQVISAAKQAELHNGTDTIVAAINQGDPNIFYNIGMMSNIDDDSYISYANEVENEIPSAMNSLAGRVRYSLGANAHHLLDVQEFSQRGDYSGYTYGNGKQYNLTQYNPIYGDFFGSRSNKCDGMIETVGSTNQIKVVANGHAVPTVTLGSESGDWFDTYNSGKTTDIKNFSNGITYSRYNDFAGLNAKYTDYSGMGTPYTFDYERDSQQWFATEDEYWMATTTVANDYSCRELDVAGTVETNGGGVFSGDGNGGGSYTFSDYDEANNATTKTKYTADSIDAIDYQSEEYHRFRYRRNMRNTLYVISDMLILQTSTGDQSVMYHWKSQTKRTQQHYDYVVSDVDPKMAVFDREITDSTITLTEKFEDMWLNQYSGDQNATDSVVTMTAKGWGTNNIGTDGGINVGGYLGLYSQPDRKFSSGVNNNRISTVFDGVPGDLGQAFNDENATKHLTQGDNFDRSASVDGTYNVLATNISVIWDYYYKYSPAGVNIEKGWMDFGGNKGATGKAYDTDGDGFAYTGANSDGEATRYISYSARRLGNQMHWRYATTVDNPNPDMYKSMPGAHGTNWGETGLNYYRAGGLRMAAPGGALRIVTDKIQQDPTNPNKKYETGTAIQTYMQILDWPATDIGEMNYVDITKDSYGRGKPGGVERYDFTKRDGRFKSKFPAETINVTDEDREGTDYRDLLSPTGHILNVKNASTYATMPGYTIEAVYSKNHTKVNDIVVHTPISVEDSVVVHNLEAEYNNWYADTRTDAEDITATSLEEKIEKLQVCSGDPDTCQFRVLNCVYGEDNVVFSSDFDTGITTKNGKTYVTNLVNTDYVYELPDGFTVTSMIKYWDEEDGEIKEFNNITNPTGFTASSKNFLSCFGTRWSIPLSDLGITYSTDTRIKIDMDFYMNDSKEKDTMLVSFYGYDFYIPGTRYAGIPTWNTGNGWERKYTNADLMDTEWKLSLIFDFSDVYESELYLNGVLIDNVDIINNSNTITEDMIYGGNATLNIGSWGRGDNYPAQFYIDNLTITQLAKGREHTAECYQIVKEHEKVQEYTCAIEYNYEYGKPIDGWNADRPYIFTAPQAGVYRVEAWGAVGGGDTTVQGADSAGGAGGYSRGYITLQKGEQIMVYPGGAGDSEPTTSTGIEYFWILTNGCGNYTSFANNATESMSGISYINSVTGAEEKTNVTLPGIWSETCPTGYTCSNHSVSVAMKDGKMVQRVGGGSSGGTVSKAWTYSYTGGVQTFTPTTTGLYKLEAWGASGGNSSVQTEGSHGGLGGYSSGYKELTAGTTYYVFVGGQGELATAIGEGAGYNGGGYAGKAGYGGGGMSHISTTNNPATAKLTTNTTYTAMTSGTKTYTDVPETGWMCTDGSYHTVVFDPDQTGTITLDATHTYVIGYHVSGCSYGGTTYVDNGWGHLYDVTEGDCLSCSHSCSISSSYPQYTLDLDATKIISTGETGLVTTSYTYTAGGTWSSTGTLIVAGGGGGADNSGAGTAVGSGDDGSGGAGGGTAGGNASIAGVVTSLGNYNATSANGGGCGSGGTQTTGFKQGVGESVTYPTDTGGAGAGWYGGYVTNHNNGGAGGGSGYVTGLTNGTTTAGVNDGNGKVVISQMAASTTNTFAGAGFNGGGSSGLYGYGGGGASDVRRLSAGGEYVLQGSSSSGYETMEYNGKTYLKVFDHDVTVGGVFASKVEAENCDVSGKFSILNAIDSYKAEGKYQFMLYYPETGLRNIWKQSKNPLKESLADTTSGTKVSGYEAVEVSMTGNYWGGLALSTNGNTLLDGSTGHDNWWFAVGATEVYNGVTTIPGGNSTLASKVQLWIVADEDAVAELNEGKTAKAMLLDNGTTTYGPYDDAPHGTYQVDIYGKGLSDCTFDVYSNGLSPKVIYNHDDLLDLKISPTHVSFYFDLETGLEEGNNGLEVRIHHGVAPDYSFDTMYISRLEDRIVVAGGGGGADSASDSNDGSGGFGGGDQGGNAKVDGTETTPGVALTDKLQAQVNTIKDSHGAWTAIGGIASSGCGLGGGQDYGYALGRGESVTYNTDSGGAGGGYYGGFVTNHENGGGAGGSGYISSQVKDYTLTSAVNTGQGKVRIEFVSHENAETSTQTWGYTGSEQVWTVPETGEYRLEVWGAQGGMYNSGHEGAKGGYASGIYTLTKGQKVYIYTGQKGYSYPNNYNTGYPFNGGGQGYGGGGDGGGASDIRIGGNTLSNRIIVAGGGGGSDLNSKAGVGGNEVGGSASLYDAAVENGKSHATGGTQNSGGYSPTGTEVKYTGTLGQGGGDGTVDAGGGGGGYYGGAVGGYGHSAGAGGSSYVGKVRYGLLLDGGSKQPSPTSQDGTQIGNSGNGYARITKINRSHNSTCTFRNTEYNYHEHIVECFYDNDIISDANLNPALKGALINDYYGNTNELRTLLGSEVYDLLHSGEERALFSLNSFTEANFKGLRADAYGSDSTSYGTGTERAVLTATAAANDVGGGNLVLTPSSTDSWVYLDTNINAGSVTKITAKVKYTGVEPGFAQLFWKTPTNSFNSSYQVKAVVEPGGEWQTITWYLDGNGMYDEDGNALNPGYEYYKGSEYWKRTITGLRFDFIGNNLNQGKVEIADITFYGQAGASDMSTFNSLNSEVFDFTQDLYGATQAGTATISKTSEGLQVSGRFYGDEVAMPIQADANAIQFVTVDFKVNSMTSDTINEGHAFRLIAKDSAGNVVGNLAPSNVRTWKPQYENQTVAFYVGDLWRGKDINEIYLDVAQGDTIQNSTVTLLNMKLFGYMNTTQKGTKSTTNFAYTGGRQSFTPTKTGTYLLEVWGAQGGDGRVGNTATMVSGSGGKGGYSQGYATLIAGTTYYVYVGGKGGEAGIASLAYGSGGYNGGGHGGTELSGETYPENGAGGGGMTHITTSSTDSFSSTMVSTTMDKGYYQPDPFSGTILGSDDDGGSDLSSKLTLSLSANTTYIFCVGRYSSSRTGSYPWTISGPSGFTSMRGTDYVDEGAWSDKTYDPDCTHVFTTTTAGTYTFTASAGDGDPCVYVSTYAETWISNVVTTYTTQDSANFNTSAALIVAGGGGGGGGSTSSTATSGGNFGGNGGGASGTSTNSISVAGTQTSGYAKRGLGGPGYSHGDGLNYGSTGGNGAGWYGGYYKGDTTSTGTYSGAGGSGYLSSSIIDGTTTAGVREGNGYARISIDEPTIIEKASGQQKVSIEYSNTFVTDINDLTSAVNSIAQYTDGATNNVGPTIPREINGTVNPIYYCWAWGYNKHICTEVCDKEDKVLKCFEPHHDGQHYETTEDAISAALNKAQQGAVNQAQEEYRLAGKEFTEADYNAVIKEATDNFYATSNWENLHSCYEACNNDENHRKIANTTVVNGNRIGDMYINTDEYFDIWFPNTGDFEENPDLHGIRTTVETRGLGYTDNMDTGRFVYPRTSQNYGNWVSWVRERYVRFSFDVLFYRAETGLWEQYLAGEWIELPVEGENNNTGYSVDDKWDDGHPRYHFYCTLNNNEQASAFIEFESEAINCAGGDGKYNLHDNYGYTGGWVYETITGEKLYRTLEYRNDRVVYNEVSNHENDNDNPTEGTNRDRRVNLTSLHGDHVEKYVDVVGRIGNIAITSTTDIRFINFFKRPDPTGTYLINGIVQEVFEDIQRDYLSWHYNNGNLAYDVRHRQVAKDTAMYNTWGSSIWKGSTQCGVDSTVKENVTQGNIDNEYELNGATNLDCDNHAADVVAGHGTVSKDPGTFPLSSDKNNIEIYTQELLKPGYTINYEITTTGNYHNRLQVKPYFYALDVEENKLIPVDVYMKTDDEYVGINYFGATDGLPLKWTDGSISSLSDEDIQEGLSSYILSLDWDNEADLRMYTAMEKELTEAISRNYIEYTTVDDNGYDIELTENGLPQPIAVRIPAGDFFKLGNLQSQIVGNQARTFLGTRYTMYENFRHSNGENGMFSTDVVSTLHDTNVWDAVDNLEYTYKAQRWHLKLGLPSSAVFTLVENGVHYKPLEEKMVDGQKVKAYEETANGDYAIVMTANIKAIGDVWNLYYTQETHNGMFKIGERKYSIDSDLYHFTTGDVADSQVVLAIYDNNTTSEVDVDTISTH